MIADDPDIHLNIHTGVEVHPVIIKARDSLRSVLRGFTSCSQLTAIHKNAVVSTGFSLAFLGIDDGADIYTIPESHPHPPSTAEGKRTLAEKIYDRQTFDRMLSELHGPDHDQEFAGMCFGHMDQTFCHELARLKDRFFERIEGNVKSHRRMLRCFFGGKRKDADASEDEGKKK
jgi:hypothetical protein